MAVPASGGRPKSVHHSTAAGAAAVEALASRAQSARFSKSLRALAADQAGSLRGAKETLVYKQAAPAVVLILRGAGLGSGVLVGADGKIVTNAHVVGSSDEVGVIFKPVTEGVEIKEADVRVGRVVRRDEVADLALIQVDSVPPSAKPLAVGSVSSIPVGSDVHAIGHPTGEVWTYTRGVVSQIRRKYQWSIEDRLEHEAMVVQTQTPINPGNSGGPLLNDQLQVVGINSFSDEGEGLNFAISGDDVNAFLARKTDRLAAKVSEPAPAAECKAKVLETSRSKDDKSDEATIDANCDGKGDGIAIYPDDPKQPIKLGVDTNGDDQIDTVYFDEDQDGNFEQVLYDTDEDGKPDLVGYFKPGDDEPSQWEKI
ncbi:MAG TPA: serine protease [Allosphingosinicella sp.]|nr:serine protease [Allosphingosinicella sp.]